MKSRYDEGNLARQLHRHTSAINYPMPDIERVDKKTKTQRDQHNEAVLNDYYSAGKMRAKLLRRLFSVFLIVLVAASFIAWRSAKIAEMSFYNTGLRRQIGEYKKESSIVYDQLSSKTSLQAIEERASATLGMQKASSDAMVHLEESNRTLGALSALGSANDNSEIIEQWVLGR